MRFAAAVALGIAVLALQGCVSSTFTALSNLGTGCTAGTTNVACTGTTTNPAANVTVPATATTPATSTNTTNTTTITSGDTTIAIEAGTVVTAVGKPAASALSNNPLTMPGTNVPGNLTPAQLQTQLTTLYATYKANPSTPAGQAALTQYNALINQMTASQQFYINTNTSSNSSWPSSKSQVYSDYGSCVTNGGADGLNPGSCYGGSTATAVQGSPTGTGGTGLGGTYKLYRAYSQKVYDEELQVWTWNNSYATQYRDVSSGGAPAAHQAWSFGGNYTVASAMPTSGTVQYAGQWTGTATTSNFTTPFNVINPALTAPTGAGNTVSPNNTWQVSGTSVLKANFANATMTGTLTPVTWVGNNSAGGFTSVNAAAGYQDTFLSNNCYNLQGTCGTNLSQLNNYLNYNSFMSTNILLSGVITTNTPAAIAASPNLKPNQVMGQAFLDPNYLGWITSSGTNPMFAGFFGNVTTGGTGTGPQEVTGNFAVSGTTTGPNSGNYAINNDKRGYLTMSGIFNGQIQ